MKRFLAFLVIASMGLIAVGCDKKGEQKTTTETKTAPPPSTDK